MFEKEFEKVEREILLEQMYKKAKETLKKNEIKLSSFIGLYDEKMIKEDEAYVQEMEKKFKETRTPQQETLEKLATLLEAIIYEQGKTNEWFGPGAETIKTSRYDDIKNGIDNVIEFRSKEKFTSYVGLAVDATFCLDVKNKIDRIKREIDSGKLSDVKYFIDTNGNRRELKGIPRVVVGLDKKSIIEIGELWAEKNKNYKLTTHQAQFQILDEIRIQLEAFKQYSMQNKKYKIAEIYQIDLEIINRIIAEKKSKFLDTGERDSMFTNIKHALKESIGFTGEASSNNVVPEKKRRRIILQKLKK